MLAPWKKSYNRPRQHNKKQRHHFADKRSYKVMIFPVVMYRCESWTIKKAECQRIDTLELWCWRRLLRVPWTAKRPVSPFRLVLKKSTLNIHSGKTDVEAPIFWLLDVKS